MQRIGIVEDSPKWGEVLKEGLEISGNEVSLYENAQEAMSAILGARFDNVPLPVETLIVDLDLCQSAEMIKRLQLFLGPDELSIIMISGSALAERNLFSQEFFDIRILQKPITPTSLLEEVEAEATANKG